MCLRRRRLCCLLRPWERGLVCERRVRVVSLSFCSVRIRSPGLLRPFESRLRFAPPFFRKLALTDSPLVSEVWRGRGKLRIPLLPSLSRPLTPGELCMEKAETSAEDDYEPDWVTDYVEIQNIIKKKNKSINQSGSLLSSERINHIIRISMPLLPFPLSHSLTYGTPGFESFLSWISTSTFLVEASGAARGPIRSSGSSSSSLTDPSGAGASNNQQSVIQTNSFLLVQHFLRWWDTIKHRSTFFLLSSRLQHAFLHLPHFHFSQSGLEQGFPLLLQMLTLCALLCSLQRGQKHIRYQTLMGHNSELKHWGATVLKKVLKHPKPITTVVSNSGF